MSSRAGRTIHPFRTSGTNQPGYSRPAQQPAAAQQAAVAPVRRAAPGNGIPPGYIASKAQNVAYVEPTFCAAEHEHGVTIRINGHRHRIPEGVEMAFGSSGGRDLVYLSRAAHSVVVLVAVDGVGVRELTGLPADVLTDLRIKHFPEAGR
jgi:hypothetical protein